MYWILIVQLLSGSEWIPAVYEHTQTPVTHIYQSEAECRESAYLYTREHAGAGERAICVEIR